MNVSVYVTSKKKRLIDVIIASLLILGSLPLLFLIGVVNLLLVGYPVIFAQDRVGKEGRVFRMYKFRTMKVGADREQAKYKNCNEADGPVFKMRNDPRFVGLGRWLSHSGLDELPQLLNVLKGDMGMVGPRPLPANEHMLLDARYMFRVIIRPGIVSSWVVTGAHGMSFSRWMELDKEYVVRATWQTDVIVLLKTLPVIAKSFLVNDK